HSFHGARWAWSYARLTENVRPLMVMLAMVILGRLVAALHIREKFAQLAQNLFTERGAQSQAGGETRIISFARLDTVGVVVEFTRPFREIAVVNRASVQQQTIKHVADARRFDAAAEFARFADCIMARDAHKSGLS